MTSMVNIQRNTLPGSDDIARAELPNGIVILARENFTSQSVVISGSLAVGSVFEAEQTAGTASLAASSLLRGTRNRDFDTIHESLEGIGASLGIGGGVHTTSFGGKSLAEDLPTLLDLLSDALRNPAFPLDQVERLRGEIITGLKIRAQDTRSVASEAFRKLAYPAVHPYSRSTTGEIETVNAITIDDLQRFHTGHYGPRGLIIVVVGAVKPDDAIRQVTAALGDWTNPAQPEVPSLPDAPALSEAHQDMKVIPGKTQSDLILGWPGPSRYAPDFQAAALANNVLGVFGMMGRLGKTVREEQGLAYYCGSQLNGGPGPGPWRVSAGINPANVQLAIDSTLREVERITTDLVSEDELADNKANFIGRLPLNLESNEGVASSILNIETYQLGLDYLRGYADMINAISRVDLLGAARKYLNPKAYALAVAGPELQK
ncbi:MAG: M16 family metallopeptidase [Aggregatilineales bacterium]